MSEVRAALREQLRAAMGARDRPAVQVLRSALAAIENAEAQPIEHGGPVTAVEEAPAAAEVARRVVTDADARTIVAAEIDELQAAVEQYRDLGRDDEADTLVAQAEVLRSVLG